MGEVTDPGRAAVLAARADAIASREALEDELELLEASVRAAIDIPAKIRRNPVRTAGVAAAAGFIVVGGPRRVLRGARNAVFGKPDPLPKSLLPDEIDKALHAMGDDGARVRGVIEREFADYLRKERPGRRRPSFVGIRALIAAQAWRIARDRVAPRVIDAVMNPDAASIAKQLERVQARRWAAAADDAAMVGEVGVEPTRPSRDTGS